MVVRTTWSEQLDEDLPGSRSGTGTIGYSADGPTPAGHGAGPLGADELPADELPADDEEDARRGGAAFAWLAALAGIALVLLLLGWWLNHDSGSVAEGATGSRPAAPLPAADAAAAPQGVTAVLAGALTGIPVGPAAGTSSGTSPSKGGVGETGGSGATGSSGGSQPGVVPGAGNGGGSGGGGGGGNGGGGTDPGTTGGTGIKAGVDANVGASGVDAGVDVGIATAPGGAVTAVAVTACAALSDLSPKLDAEAKVTWANGYEATGVKLTGLTLLNLLDPGTLKVSTGGSSYTVPAGVDVKVGLCLGL